VSTATHWSADGQATPAIELPPAICWTDHDAAPRGSPSNACPALSTATQSVAVRQAIELSWSAPWSVAGDALPGDCELALLPPVSGG